MSYKAIVQFCGVTYEIPGATFLECFEQVAVIGEMEAQIKDAKNPDEVRLMHRVLNGKYNKYSLYDPKAGEVLDFGQPDTPTKVNIFAYSKTAAGYKGWQKWGHREVEDNQQQVYETPVETDEMAEINAMVDEMYGNEAGEKMVAFCQHISKKRTNNLKGLKPSEVDSLFGQLKERYNKWLLERGDKHLPF